MTYLSLDALDVSALPYPKELNRIRIRGTLDKENVYFSYIDVENAFCLKLPARTTFVWINTPSGRDKYLSYTTLLRLKQAPPIETFVHWIDFTLFGISAKLSRSSSNDLTDTESDLSSCYDDNESSYSISDIEDTEIALNGSTYQLHRSQDSLSTTDRLSYELQLAKKDNLFYQQRLQLKEKEIELLQLRLTLLESKPRWF